MTVDRDAGRAEIGMSNVVQGWMTGIWGVIGVRDIDLSEDSARSR